MGCVTQADAPTTERLYNESSRLASRLDASRMDGITTNTTIQARRSLAGARERAGRYHYRRASIIGYHNVQLSTLENVYQVLGVLLVFSVVRSC